jgi:ankyrin repeat protein
MKSRKQRIHKRKTFRNRGLNRKTRSKTQLRKRNKSIKMKGSGLFSRLFSGHNKPTNELFEHFYKKTDINPTNDELEQLIKEGADIHAKDRDKMTPLLWATYNNNTEISRLLVKRRADIDAKNRFDETALLIATSKNNFEISQLLINAEANVNVEGIPLLYAVKNKNLEICELLINAGADVNAKSGYSNYTPLLLAIKNNNYEICELLIERGAEVNMYGEIFNKRVTPLIWAVMNNNLEICKLLIERGADVNAKVYYDNTALLYAVKNKNFDICKLLINAGADIHAQTKSGLLPPYSYSTTMQNLLRTTPLSYATSLNARKYADIINLFKKADNVAGVEEDEDNETTVINPLHDTDTPLDMTHDM